MKNPTLAIWLATLLITGLLISLPAPLSAFAQPTENTAPVANDQNVTAIEETAIMIFLTASDPEEDNLDYTIVTQPSFGLLSGPVKNPTYTPNLNFFGNDTFTFKVNDGEFDSNIATVTISVTNVNDNPVAVDDAYEVEKNGVLIVAADDGILSNDDDPDNDVLTALEIDDVDHGILTFRDDGSFVYKPDQNYVGEDVFTYRAFDGEVVSGLATVTISVVLNANVLPDAIADSYEVYSGILFTADLTNSVLVNDIDEDGDVLTASILGLPAMGTLEFNSDGTFTYISDAGYIGDDHFTYVANDEEGSSIPAMVTITVIQGPLINNYLPFCIR